MKAYLLSLVGAILLSAIVTALVSDKKMGRFVKGMSNLLVFAIVVTPLVSLFDKKEFPFQGDDAELTVDAGYFSRCAELCAEAYEEEVGRYLEETFSVRADVDAVCTAKEGFPLEKIVAKVFSDGIIGQDEHIDMVSRIEEAIRGKYGCDTEVLWQQEG